ncbi:hypothetical protein T190115A13A_160032 [Tenacibaculum sp. 190524A02b]|uniref:Uncharacterized protein n=1 Tax=Tenacibaculum vairaonense TaxID=3137860 RepID=A0ABP1FAT1_9FLAO
MFRNRDVFSLNVFHKITNLLSLKIDLYNLFGKLIVIELVKYYALQHKKKIRLNLRWYKI